MKKSNEKSKISVKGSEIHIKLSSNDEALELVKVIDDAVSSGKFSMSFSPTDVTIKQSSKKV